ncbi:MAG: hypothetical protein Q8S00_32680 [Deltaproteobacteria bacterium]|nr:hypothetical protein [Deltaproteobacteria bacterium]
MSYLGLGDAASDLRASRESAALAAELSKQRGIRGRDLTPEEVQAITVKFIADQNAAIVKSIAGAARSPKPPSKAREGMFWKKLDSSGREALYVFRGNRWILARAADRVAATQPTAVFRTTTAVARPCKTGDQKRDFRVGVDEQSVCIDGAWLRVGTAREIIDPKAVVKEVRRQQGEEAAAQLEEALKRKRLIMYAGIAAAAIGIGLLLTRKHKSGVRVTA